MAVEKKKRILHILVALNGALAVFFSAFATHWFDAIFKALHGTGLEEWTHDAVLSFQSIFKTGAQYQLIHAVVVLVLYFAIRQKTARPQSMSAKMHSACLTSIYLFLVSTFVFSGSLYALSLSGQRWLGAITPIGGLGLIIAWLSLGRSCWRD